MIKALTTVKRPTKSLVEDPPIYDKETGELVDLYGYYTYNQELIHNMKTLLSLIYQFTFVSVEMPYYTVLVVGLRSRSNHSTKTYSNTIVAGSIDILSERERGVCRSEMLVRSIVNSSKTLLYNEAIYRSPVPSVLECQVCGWRTSTSSAISYRWTKTTRHSLQSWIDYGRWDTPLSAPQCCADLFFRDIYALEP